jgi:hypothetical protein
MSLDIYMVVRIDYVTTARDILAVNVEFHYGSAVVLVPETETILGPERETNRSVRFFFLRVSMV